MTLRPLEINVRLALDRFDLRVDVEISRPVTGVFGASGSGKTSLLETLAGLRRGARGRIVLGDEVWLDSVARRSAAPEHRRVGYVPQDGLLFPHLDVRANLLVGTARARRTAGPAFDTVVELLELAPFLSRRTVTLSGGERQRVALGRALCSDPEILLLDEPLASLDLPLRRRLLPFLARIRAELTVPMILVSHDPVEVQALCDDLVVLRRGAVIAHGEPRQVLTDPEVFSLAEQGGFENILPGRIEARGDGVRKVRLTGGAELVTRDLETAAGRDVLVGIPSAEIVVATERPQGLSARNVLPATITELRSLGTWDLLTVELGPETPPVTVEVTSQTPGELGLVRGREVYLVIKATSCRVYGAE